MSWLVTSGLAGYMGEITNRNEPDQQAGGVSGKGGNKLLNTVVIASGFIDEDDEEVWMTLYRVLWRYQHLIP